MTTLPSFTRTMDDDFVDTWYEIREESIDNILGATAAWNALMEAGCFVEQVGSEIITRTIGYGTADAEDVNESTVMSSSEPELDTMAIWYWKYVAANVQRSIIKDQQNSGPSKIKDYVGRRITAATDALEQKFETNLFSSFKSTENATDVMQGLNDMVPPLANRSTGTYGGITRPATYGTDTVEVPATGNTWWGPYYMDGVLGSIAVNLLDDMKTLYNGIGANQQPPNLILTTQAVFEVYETFALDISQIIKDETTRLADLGFDVLRFKGKPVIWDANVTANNLMFLNTDWIEVVYDPNLWFDMTDWKPGTLEFRRAAQIICAVNVISSQLRRHGRLVYA